MRSKVAVGWAGFAIGALTFLAAHAIERMRWTAWFGAAHDPWFLNSGSAVVFTTGCLFGVGLIAGALAVPGLTVAVGASVAMTAVLFLKEGGPGTIFPIVMVAGGMFILISTTLGAWIGREARAAGKRR